MNINSERGFGKPFSVISALPESSMGKGRPSLLPFIQSTADGVLIVDASRQIVFVNSKAERIFGYPASDLLDRSLDLLLPGGDAGEQRRRVERLVALGKGARRTRLTLRGMHADGAALTLRTSASRVNLHGNVYVALAIHQWDRNHGKLQERPCKGRPAELRRWAASSQHASEVEKRRFSRKLYDDIGQRLSVLKLDLDWLENSLPSSTEGLPARLAQMQGLLDNVITMTKSMASALRPPLLDDFGLLPAVEWMAANFEKRTSTRCTVEPGPEPIRLEEPAESAIFRVIQEGLANVERHAHARQVTISIAQTEHRLDVMIQDDGVGLGSGGIDKPGCYGLLAMQERIFVLGGTISIDNAEPTGVVIRASIPLEGLSEHDLHHGQIFR